MYRLSSNERFCCAFRPCQTSQNRPETAKPVSLKVWEPSPPGGWGDLEDVLTTKLYVPVLTPCTFCNATTRLGLKMPSLLLCATSGKKSWVVRIGPPGACTFTCIWIVRPGYSPGTIVSRR